MPPVFARISNAVFLYDGSPASVFALRQYACHVDSKGEIPVEILSVKEALYPGCLRQVLQTHSSKQKVQLLLLRTVKDIFQAIKKYAFRIIICI